MEQMGGEEQFRLRIASLKNPNAIEK